jgi:hypothetical protein
LVLSFAPLAWAPVVTAQPAAEDPTTQMARARFKEGVDFYDKGEYEHARGAFLQAYALKKHPAVLLNLAWSSLKAGRALEAEKYFKQFLSEGKDINEKQRGDANDGLAQARAKLGRIEVVAPPGTEVTIDGDRLGSAPLAEPVSVEAGAHTVKFKSLDGIAETNSVTVLGGEKVVSRSSRLAAVATTTVPQLPPTVPPAASATEPAPLPLPPAPGVPPPATDTVPPPSHLVPRPEPPPADEGQGGPFAPPRNVWPVVVLGSVAALGVATALVAGVYYKGNASDNKDRTEAEIRAAAHCPTTGPCPVCSNPPANFTQACSAYSGDIDNINADATVGNIGIAVAAAGAAGALIYWLAADKGREAAGAGPAAPVISPAVGLRFTGVSVSGRF